jgi:hypothetical protein
VTSIEGGSRLAGTFSIHPFHKILVFLPWVIPVPVLLWAPKSPRTLLFLLVLSVVFLAIEAAIVRASIRLLPKEQQDIVQFLLTLFSQKHSKLEAESS